MSSGFTTTATSGGWACSSCGAVNKSGMKFCTTCGGPATTTASSPLPLHAKGLGYSTAPPPGKRPQIRKVIFLGAVALVVILVLAALALVAVIRPNRQTVESAPAAAAEAPAHRQPTNLPLRVEGSKGVLTILWDGLAAPISNAPRGVLTIRDGAGAKNFDLTADELRKGAYEYKPLTDDVLVRLELEGLPDNQTAFGAARILGARMLKHGE